MTLVKVLYRDLLQLSRVYDRDVALRAMISAQMLQSVPSNSPQVPHLAQFNRALMQFLQNRSFFWPTHSTNKPTSLTLFLQSKFRTVGSVDAALLALKVLNEQLAMAHDIGVTTKSIDDNTSKRKAITRKLVVNEAERLSSGVFLVAHPLTRGTFSRSVVLLIEHTQQKGSTGVIVNHPTSMSVMRSFRIPSDIMETMGANKVHSGGPVSSKHAEILHAHEEFGGQLIQSSNFFKSNRSANALFFGADINAASQAIQAERTTANDIMWIKGISGWSPGQLEQEMQQGAWIAVHAPLSISIHAKRDLWEEIMEALGGDFKQLCRIPELQNTTEEEEEEEDA